MKPCLLVKKAVCKVIYHSLRRFSSSSFSKKFQTMESLFYCLLLLIPFCISYIDCFRELTFSYLENALKIVMVNEFLIYNFLLKFFFLYYRFFSKNFFSETTSACSGLESTAETWYGNIGKVAGLCSTEQFWVYFWQNIISKKKVFFWASPQERHWTSKCTKVQELLHKCFGRFAKTSKCLECRYHGAYLCFAFSLPSAIDCFNFEVCLNLL